MSILLALLIAVPGLLIPLWVISRLRAVTADRSRAPSERAFARGTMALMVGLMGFSVYAALEIFRLIGSIAGS